MRAAIGERVDLIAHADERDSVAADLDHADPARLRQLGEIDPRHRPAHAGTAVLRSKKRAALPCAIASRQSAGSRLSVWRGSSKSQCG